MQGPMVIDRNEAIERFRRGRRRSAELFGLIPDASYFDRPIALRNPICFYDGHLPAFSVNTFWKRAMGEPGIDAGFEKLFERGIDPEEEAEAGGSASAWPSRAAIGGYGREADARIEEAILSRPLEDDANPLLERGQALFTILEHEVMHQETLHYMWRRIPYDRKARRNGHPAALPGPERAPSNPWVLVPAGTATLGADSGRFGWDNEFPRHTVEVPSFEMSTHDVTNEEFRKFMEAGGYRREDLWDAEGWSWIQSADVSHPPFWIPGAKTGEFQWLGMFERIPLPAAWPAWVTQAEASAYARWKGARLPTEAEYDRAAYGNPSGAAREFPWGDGPPDGSRGNFDFRQWEPVAAGSFPAGASAWGIHDLVGNGWEWTSTVFDGFPGFAPMASYPQYSADFFDGKHYVMKGASPVTGRDLVRRSFRNWFRPAYPHVYASFHLVRDAAGR
jgi:gamma-glutamyl hercynylcysteine S-oxide synthase